MAAETTGSCEWSLVGWAEICNSRFVISFLSKFPNPGFHCTILRHSIKKFRS